MEPNKLDKHMGWRGRRKNYRWPGTYHITINVLNRELQPLGHITGDVSKPDNHPLAPKVHLSELGKMVEHELLHSISSHYPMVEIQDYVIMPDHLHFIVVVHRDIISNSGRETHLGQVIAGFKKGCNRRYWELTGQTAQEWQGKPAPASTQPSPSSVLPTSPSAVLPTSPSAVPPLLHPTVSLLSPPAVPPLSHPAVSPLSHPAVPPQEKKVPSNGTTGRPPLFDYGYVDVMPLKEGQLEQQREYIRNNPRYRLMRQKNPKGLKPQRASVKTALTLSALKGYLQRECNPNSFDDETWEKIKQRLLHDNSIITCDSYGNAQLLTGTLLPVVCHRKDAHQFEVQKARCLAAATGGAVLVSAKIAKREQDIMNEAIAQGYPVVTVEDNGFPSIYHPSEHRMDICNGNKLLIVTPWQYTYRRVSDTISVTECKTMNCIVQALCRTKDSWWKA